MQVVSLVFNGGCSILTFVLHQACYWRFDWFQNADDPDADFEEARCPQAMIDRTGLRALESSDDDGGRWAEGMERVLTSRIVDCVGLFGIHRVSVIRYQVMMSLYVPLSLDSLFINRW